MEKTKEDLPGRIRDKIFEDANGCWLWQSTIHPRTGYGQVWWKGGTRSAHRVVYELLIGPAVPSLDHLCRVRSCVNPSHLEPVTQRENLLRSDITQAAINAAKTQCPKGHPLSGANLKPNRYGRRICRTCNLEQQAAYKARRKAMA